MTNQTKEVSHTPTPWHINGEAIESDHKWVASAGSNGINDEDEDMVNAAFIVRAVNSHEALLQAAKAIQAWFDNEADAGRETPTLLDVNLSKAIAQAEGK